MNEQGGAPQRAQCPGEETAGSAAGASPHYVLRVDVTESSIDVEADYPGVSHMTHPSPIELVSPRPRLDPCGGVERGPGVGVLNGTVSGCLHPLTRELTRDSLEPWNSS